MITTEQLLEALKASMEQGEVTPVKKLALYSIDGFLSLDKLAKVLNARPNSAPIVVDYGDPADMWPPLRT